MTDHREYQQRSYDEHYRKRLSAVEEQLRHPHFCSFYDRLARRALELGVERPNGRTDGPLRVFEPGCGEGLLAAALQRVAGQLGLELSYTGADLSPAALDITRASVPGDLRAGDATEVSTALPSASHDLAVVKNVLHHLDEPAALLRQLARVLTPRGRLVILESRLGSPQIWITAGLANRRERYLFHGQRRNLAALRDAGFRLVHRERFSWLPYELAFAIRPGVLRRIFSTDRPSSIERATVLDDRLTAVLPWLSSYALWVAVPATAPDSAR